MGEYIHTLHSGDEHTRFSSALGNFSRDQVSPVVAKHCGRVIYAGGDDVLALLPADTALSCAQALREEFHRTMPSGLDASVGIAIAHFKTPLQDIVRAAQMAERRAKNQLNRSAVAVTLYKRSGETVEWGTNWQSGGLELYDALAAALKNDHVSVKFPQRVVELLAPYLSEQTGLVKTVPSPEFENVVDEIMQREFAAVCDRQCKPAWKREVSETISPLLKKYISHLKGAETKLRDIIGLCQTVAFAHRIRDNDAEHEPGTQVTAERQPV
jgi:CRISPR-associated protein Cmr2